MTTTDQPRQTYVRWRRGTNRVVAVLPPMPRGVPVVLSVPAGSEIGRLIAEGQVALDGIAAQPCAQCGQPLGHDLDLALIAVGPDDPDTCLRYVDGLWFSAFATSMHLPCVVRLGPDELEDRCHALLLERAAETMGEAAPLRVIS